MFLVPIISCSHNRSLRLLQGRLHRRISCAKITLDGVQVQPRQYRWCHSSYKIPSWCPWPSSCELQLFEMVQTEVTGHWCLAAGPPSSPYATPPSVSDPSSNQPYIARPMDTSSSRVCFTCIYPLQTLQSLTRSQCDVFVRYTI